MKKKMIIIISFVLVALTGLAFATNQYHGTWCDATACDSSAREHRINYVKDQLTEKLALNETQKVELDRIVDGLKEKHAELKSHHPEVKTQFIEAMQKEHLTAEDIHNIIESRRPEFEELLMMVSHQIADFHNMLTPDQRTKLIEELESHQGRCPFGH